MLKRQSNEGNEIVRQLLDRIDRLGVADRKVSMLATKEPTTVRNIRRAHAANRAYNPRIDTLEALLRAINDLEAHPEPLPAPPIVDLQAEDISDSIEPPHSRKVKLKGYVGAGAEAHYYALADEEFEEVDAPAGATDQTVAVEIKGVSLGPLFATWLVYYDDVRSPVTEDLVGQLCVVGLADDRILIKKIVRNRRGGYDLKSNSGEDEIDDALIEWAAKVKDMRPRH